MPGRWNNATVKPQAHFHHNFPSGGWFNLGSSCQIFQGMLQNIWGRKTLTANTKDRHPWSRLVQHVLGRAGILTIKWTSFPIFCYLEIPTGSLFVNYLIQLAEKHFWEATELCGFPNKNFLFSLSCKWKFAVLYVCDVEVSLNLLVDKGVWNHNNLSLYTIITPDKLMRSVVNALRFSFSLVIVQLEAMFGFTVPKSFKYFELQLKHLKTFILLVFF